MEHKIVLSITTISSRIGQITKILNSIIDKNKSSFIIHIFYSTESKLYDDGCTQTDIEILHDYILKFSNEQIQIKLSETENIGPYRKLIPALKLYCDHIIITIDDDEIFYSNIVDIFVELYLKHKCIVCSCASIVDIKNCLNMNDSIEYYKKIYESDNSYLNLIPQGYGGILYHSSMFKNDFINFDYKSLNELVLRNDDIFIRTYTYKKEIKVFLTNISQSNIYNFNISNSLYKSNRDEKLSKIFEQVLLFQEKLTINNNLDCSCLNDENIFDEINKLLELNKIQQSSNFNFAKFIVHNGTDVKKLQYKINHEPNKNSEIKYFDINQSIRKLFFPKTNQLQNVILINIESDTHRYSNAITEFKKLLITDFVHLKATYWKQTEQFLFDMEYIINFLIKFNNENLYTNANKKLILNSFSEFDDPNIIIQDGPLACYCSHVRALIYGYLNFDSYTIIAEDDLNIYDINSIRDNIEMIPTDWDIICFGANPINKHYEGSFYKFEDLFHSTHFYIVKNSCMKTIFENIYPIDDQIDILLSKLNKKLNIYNIPFSVCQKNYETNTQNNLFVIYNSPNYEYVRIRINRIKSILGCILKNNFCDKVPDIYKSFFEKNIKNICLKILFDVIFDKIVSINDFTYVSDDNLINNSNETMQNVDFDENYKKYFTHNDYEKLQNEIFILIDGCVKGTNTNELLLQIINSIREIIEHFSTVQQSNSDSEYIVFPLNYGSSSNIFSLYSNNLSNIDECIILKCYVDKPRWKNLNRKNLNRKNLNRKNKERCEMTILEKEIKIYNILHNSDNFIQMIKHTNNSIYLEWGGYSLFDNFVLVNGWQKQIKNIFDELDKYNIYYPEFNLKNITCKNEKLYFIDFGLAEIHTDDIADSINNENCKIFIELLEMIEEKFISVSDVEQQHIYYNNLITNIKLNKKSKYSDNIF